jgi:hypothetical protein
MYILTHDGGHIGRKQVVTLKTLKTLKLLKLTSVRN